LRSSFFWNAYGSPLSYARPIDLTLLTASQSRLRSIVDLGCGLGLHLAALASVGVRAAGVEASPVLVGALEALSEWFAHRCADGGELRLVGGTSPSQPSVAAKIGGRYQLLLAKNVFKHPAKVHWPHNPLASLQRALAPGGVVCLYNIGFLKPRRTRWSDTRIPFDSRMWRRAGFELLADGVDDSETARLHAQALGWDRGRYALRLDGMIAHYTLARRAR
jgi:SAM-dependent methyltransferase